MGITDHKYEFQSTTNLYRRLLIGDTNSRGETPENFARKPRKAHGLRVPTIAPRPAAKGGGGIQFLDHEWFAWSRLRDDVASGSPGWDAGSPIEFPRRSPRRLNPALVPGAESSLKQGRAGFRFGASPLRSGGQWWRTEEIQMRVVRSTVESTGAIRSGRTGGAKPSTSVVPVESTGAAALRSRESHQFPSGALPPNLGSKILRWSNELERFIRISAFLANVIHLRFSCAGFSDRA